MSVGSDIREKTGQTDGASIEPAASFSGDAVPYFLSTADAFVILFSSVVGGIGYHLLSGIRCPMFCRTARLACWPALFTSCE